MFEGVGNLVGIVVSSLLLIVLGLIYFMVNLWIVVTGAQMFNLTPTMPVLSAVLLTLAGILASALSHKK
jgi:hypothetical protein